MYISQSRYISGSFAKRLIIMRSQSLGCQACLGSGSVVTRRYFLLSHLTVIQLFPYFYEYGASLVICINLQYLMFQNLLNHCVWSMLLRLSSLSSIKPHITKKLPTFGVLIYHFQICHPEIQHHFKIKCSVEILNTMVDLRKSISIYI